MDKSWMNLSRVDLRYFNGIENFIKFARQNSNEATYPCPCCRCKLGRWVGLDKMRTHLIDKGFMVGYTTWTLHGEVELGDDQLEDNFGQVSGEPNELYNIPMVEFLNDTFPLRDYQDPMMVDETFDEADYEVNRLANEKYHKLLVEAQTPIYPGSKETVLECILYEMQLKVEGRWSDKSFDRHLERCKRLIRGENKYPGSYREIKHLLSNLGLNYEVIHACEHGCVLYYKELSDLDNCPVCGEARYDYVDGNRKAAKKFVRYFPITPRLQRLYTSPYVAKEMRWHGERRVSEGLDDLRHPADGDTWKNFNKQFPDFSNEIRNVRLGLAPDGFNPFGVASTSHSTWPIVVMPFNLPPSMCLKKEFNILAMLISGPKSPGKCLNVFMRPLIDELQVLWSKGVPTLDRYSGSCFTMRVAVMWTISDFPGLGMLGGIQTKGYKACPECLDNIDSKYSNKRMSYQGHRRWLPKKS
ncbi:unnamed protein product [Rhodiola kirilowii]